jgi:peptidoglycan/xylan/chitin deacetylase (PgdA/CDA1 family)
MGGSIDQGIPDPPEGELLYAQIEASFSGPIPPLVLWGPLPFKDALRLLMLIHLSSWFCGIFAPNSRLFGPILSRGNGEEKKIALTFDDGPSEPYFPLILDTLKRYGVKATFFVVGKKAEVRQDLVQRIHEEGHLIGNRTYNHPPYMAFEGLFGRKQVMEEIERGGAVLEGITGDLPNLFRPPQGFKNHLILEVCREKGITLVGYTHGPPYCANGHSPSALAERMVRSTQPGSIRNFHDGWRTGKEWACEEMVHVLSKIKEKLRAQGYRLVTLQEMIEEKGDRG